MQPAATDHVMFQNQIGLCFFSTREKCVDSQSRKRLLNEDKLFLLPFPHPALDFSVLITSRVGELVEVPEVVEVEPVEAWWVGGLVVVGVETVGGALSRGGSVTGGACRIGTGA